jgi:hypothetical protein
LIAKSSRCEPPRLYRTPPQLTHQLRQAAAGASRAGTVRHFQDVEHGLRADPLDAFKPVDLKGRVSSEVVADLVPGARVVKAFNHLRAEVLAGDPRSDGGRRVLFYSGNDSAAKAEVAALIDRIGFVGIDLGSLAVGGRLAQFPGGPLPNQNLVKVA